MATVNPVITDAMGNGQVMKFEWTLTSANADGAPIGPKYLDYSDRTVYFTGTFGTATAGWEGGDGSTYIALADPQGTAISKTTNSIESVLELPEYSRPRLTTPGSGATVVVTCIARKGFRRGA
jgi:hypothetical protein